MLNNMLADAKLFYTHYAPKYIIMNLHDNCKIHIQIVFECRDGLKINN